MLLKEKDPVYFTSYYIPVTGQTGLGSVAVATLALVSFSFFFFCILNILSVIMTLTS